MSTLTVLKFFNSGDAERALDTLQDLQKQSLIKIYDAAIVSWPEGKRRPTTKNFSSTTGVGALDGAFWGMLFGLLFFVPFLGAAVGAGIGALTGSLTDLGIDDNFIKDVRDKVSEGTSALFLMSGDAVMDRVVDAFQHTKFEIIATNLSKEEEAKLQEVFAEARA